MITVPQLSRFRLVLYRTESMTFTTYSYS